MIAGGRRSAPAWGLAVLLAGSCATSHQTSEPGPGSRFYGTEAIPGHRCEGEPVPSCVERLRTQLRAELGRRELSRLDPDRCETSHSLPCIRTYEPCTPVAGVMLTALAELKEQASPATPEILEASKRPELDPFAFDALVAVRSPEVVSRAILRLGDAEVTCRRSGFLAIKELGTAARAAAPALERILAEGDWSDRKDAAQALGAIRDPTAIGALQSALRGPPATAQKAAAVALSAFGREAMGAVPALEELALTHWAWSVRNAAARTAGALSGRSISPRPVTCRSRPLTQGENLIVEVEGRKETLHTLATAPGGGRGACAGADAGWALFPLLEAGETCIAGENLGESGGSILALRGNKREPLRQGWNVNPIRAVQLSGTTLVIEGLAHLGLSTGMVTRLWRHPGGRWRADPILELPGLPLAFATTRGGQLLLLTEDRLDRDDLPCPSLAGSESRGVYLLRIDPDGSAESLP